jgi:hypothetical protein
VLAKLRRTVQTSTYAFPDYVNVNALSKIIAHKVNVAKAASASKYVTATVIACPVNCALMEYAKQVVSLTSAANATKFALITNADAVTDLSLVLNIVWI